MRISARMLAEGGWWVLMVVFLAVISWAVLMALWYIAELAAKVLLP